MEMKQNKTFCHGTYSNLRLFYQNILKYFNDFQIAISQFYDSISQFYKVNPNNGNETK